MFGKPFHDGQIVREADYAQEEQGQRYPARRKTGRGRLVRSTRCAVRADRACPVFHTGRKLVDRRLAQLGAAVGLGVGGRGDMLALKVQEKACTQGMLRAASLKQQLNPTWTIRHGTVQRKTFRQGFQAPTQPGKRDHDDNNAWDVGLANDEFGQLL